MNEGQAQGLEERIGHEGEHDGEEHQDGVAGQGIPGEGSDAEAKGEHKERDHRQGVSQIGEGGEQGFVHRRHHDAHGGIPFRIDDRGEHEQGLALPQVHRIGNDEGLQVGGGLDAGLEGGLALPRRPEALQLWIQGGSLDLIDPWDAPDKQEPEARVGLARLFQPRIRGLRCHRSRSGQGHDEFLLVPKDRLLVAAPQHGKHPEIDGKEDRAGGQESEDLLLREQG